MSNLNIRTVRSEHARHCSIDRISLSFPEGRCRCGRACLNALKLLSQAVVAGQITNKSCLIKYGGLVVFI